ncbi:MAG TPA: sugar ABC transporter substrate-binding protein [Cellulomonas sp.]
MSSRTHLSRFRSVGVAAGVGATLAALAACGSSSSSSSSSSATADPVTLTMYMWTSSQEEVDAWESVADLVTEEYPEITIEFQTADWANYWTKLVADVSGGTDLCIVGVQSLRIPGVSDLLVPLDDAMTDTGIDAADFDSSILEAMQVDGEQLGIPYDYGPLMMYYNKDLFAAAGVAEPELDWTVDDFEAAIEAISATGTYGTIVYPNADYTEPWALNLGGVQAVDSDGELAVTDPDYVSSMETIASWVSAGYAPEVPAGAGWALDQFNSGNVATAVDGPWNLINTNASADFEVGIAPVPAGDGGQSTVTEGSGFGIAQSCQNQDEAAKALSVITGADAAEQLATAGRAFPARIAQQDYWYANVDDATKEAMEYAIDHTEAQRTTENWTSVVDAFTQYGVDALNGNGTVADFLDQVQSTAGSGS